MDWTAVGSIVLGGCALVTTIYQAHLSRKHNRLSVRPHLTRHTDIQKDTIGATYRFTLSNCGIGPALISELYFLVDGERFPSSRNSSDEVAAVVEAVIGRKYAYELLEHGLPGEASALSPGQTFVIAVIRFPIANGLIREAIESEIDRIDMSITYKSMYDEVFKEVSA